MERCFWCNLENPLYVSYHDHEWGVLRLDDSYLFEMLIISLKTTLVGGLLCFIITNIISSIPIIDVNFAISFGTFFTITFGLILINLIVSIIPISRYMRLTPSQILTKHDL